MDAQPTFTTSESIANIAAALAKAQGAYKPILKNRTVEVSLKDGKGKYTFAYATLDSVIDATREALSQNGICHTAMVANGRIVVKLFHASGEWFAADVPVPPPAAGWQAFGSAITYARRYLLTPLLGVASEEDDDGNAAEGNQVANGPDPLQKLWDAMDKTDIPAKGSNAVRAWCEAALGRPVPHPSTIDPRKDLPILMAALIKETSKPGDGAAEKKPATATSDAEKVALTQELNRALNELAPWGSAADGKSAKESANIKVDAKLRWANAMLGNPRPPFSAFGSLSGEQLRKLIDHAKAGEMPNDDAMPEWMEEDEKKV